MPRLKVMKLFCTECDKRMGEPRPGKGRQKLLCAQCREDKRRETARKQDLKRMEERRSQKNRLRSGDKELSIDEHRITVRDISKRKT